MANTKQKYAYNESDENFDMMVLLPVDLRRTIDSVELEMSDAELVYQLLSRERENRLYATDKEEIYLAGRYAALADRLFAAVCKTANELYEESIQPKPEPKS